MCIIQGMHLRNLVDTFEPNAVTSTNVKGGQPGVIDGEGPDTIKAIAALLGNDQLLHSLAMLHQRASRWLRLHLKASYFKM